MTRVTKRSVRSRRVLESFASVGVVLVAVTGVVRGATDWSWLPFMNGLGAGLFCAAVLGLVVPKIRLWGEQRAVWEDPEPPAYDERDRALRLQALSAGGLVLAIAVVVFLALDVPPESNSSAWMGGALILAACTYFVSLWMLDRRGGEPQP